MVYFWIGVGGIAGALLRYGLYLLMYQWTGPLFPWGTLAENWIGCFVLGWFNVWAHERLSLSPQLRTSLGTGLIGSFTTFSTFNVDTWELVMYGDKWLGLFYVLASFWGGILLAWVGWRLGLYLQRERLDLPQKGESP